MPPRRKKADDERAQLFELLRAFLASTSGSWTKLAVAFVALVVTLWGFAGFGDRIGAVEQQVDAIDLRVDFLQADVVALSSDVTAARDDVDEMQTSVKAAARQLGNINETLEDLHKIRKDIKEAFAR